MTRTVHRGGGDTRVKARRVLLCVLLASSLAIPAGAQTMPGTDYWFSPIVFDNLDPEAEAFPSRLDLVADVPANVVISGAASWEGVVGPDQPVTLDLEVVPRASEDGVVTDKGIHIVSDSPVIAVWRAWFGAFDETVLLRPTPALGTDHVVLTYPWFAQGLGAGFHVTATADATTIEYVDICDFDRPTVSVQLDRGQTYFDLCPKWVEGYRVTSDKPVALTAYSDGQYIPYDPLGCCADPLVEQMRPVADWGTVHHVPRLPRGEEATELGDLVRIAPANDATSVEITGPEGTVSDILDAGQVREYDLEGPLRIVASDVVGVQVTYKSHYVTDKGDPHSLSITPERLARPAYRVYAPEIPSPGNSWEQIVTIITEGGPDAGLTVDGIPVEGTWQAIPGSARQQIDLPLEPGVYLLEAARPMTAYHHAYRIHESFAAPASPSTVTPTCEATARAFDLELCPDDEPLLDASSSLVVRCDGDTEYRWLEEGSPLGPFTTDPLFLADPPVGETVYSLEVRCASDPTCADRIDFLVTRHPPAPLEDIGATLRVSKIAALGNDRIFLDWFGFSPPGIRGEHYHAHKARSPLGPFLRMDQDPELTLRTVPDLDPQGRLLFYDVRLADACETISADPFPHTTPSDCFEPALACSHGFTGFLEESCPAELDAHACTAVGTAGAERAHVLALESGQQVRVDLREADPSLEVFLYDEALTTCIAGGGTSLEADLPAGVYRVLVDGPAGVGGRYVLEARCF